MKTKLTSPLLIGEDYKLTADKMQFILSTRYVGKDKKTQQPKDQWSETYHPTFKQVANYICERELKESLQEDLKTAISSFEQKIDLLTNKLEVAN